MDLWAGNLHKWTSSGSERAQSWLVVFCDDSSTCMTTQDKRLLGAMLDGLASLGNVDCSLDTDVCDKLRPDGERDTPQLVFFPSGLEDDARVKMTSSIHEFRDIAEEVLYYIKNLKVHVAY